MLSNSMLNIYTAEFEETFIILDPCQSTYVRLLISPINIICNTYGKFSFHIKNAISRIISEYKDHTLICL
jgi:hypothetical protein